VLLDAHAILHRAYHALPEFSSSKGEPTGALYGLSAMLIKLISDLKPDYIVACYDLPGPTFRHEAYEAYKAKRPKTDNDLISQLNRSRDIFNVFAIPMYEKEGFEADDIIGTITHAMKSELKSEKVEIIIASGDMDTLQLVDDKKVQVYTLKKGINDTILYDEIAVKERFGFPPEKLVDFKGLRGDPSDNIMGVAGIGEKTATLLIQAFGTIEEIYKKLKKDSNVFEKKGFKKRVVGLLHEGEEEAFFSKTLATIRLDVPISFSLPKKVWKESFDIKKVEKLFNELSFRTLAVRAKKLASSREKEAPEEKKENVDDAAIGKAGIALWLLNSDYTNPSLEDILQFAGTASPTKARDVIFEELKKNKKLEKIYNEIELPLAPILEETRKRGILIDTKYLKELSKKYHKELEKLQGKIWEEAGIEFNINSPKQLAEILFDKLALSTKGLRKTEGGARSTRESELSKLKGSHKIIDFILEHREFQKLLSTYIDNIPEMVDKDGRLHSTFVQTGTTTGRLSSMNPNLQNIPIRSEQGKAIRKAFIASFGHTLLALDYSQIELRALALLSQDKDLLDIFKKGKDVHTAVAAEVFNVRESDVTSDMRRKAKVINFGIIYGMGVTSLQRTLGSSRAEAQVFYDNYFSEFPGVAHYLEEVKREAARRGYTETLFGRRRYFQGLHSHISYIRSSAERMAVNAPIQGTATGDIIKLAIVKVNNVLKEKNLLDKAFLLIQVHDELIYEVGKENVEEITSLIKKTMEDVLRTKDFDYQLDSLIPLEVTVSTGKNWGEMNFRGTN